MQNKTKLQTIGTALLISIMLTGCAEHGTQPNNPPANSNSYAAESSKPEATPSISDDFIATLNSAIDSSEDIKQLEHYLKDADIEEHIGEIRVFDSQNAFVNDIKSSDGKLNQGAIVYITFDDQKNYITFYGERLSDPIPEMFSSIIARASTTEQLMVEISGYNLGLNEEQRLTSISFHESYDKALPSSGDSGEAIVENGKLVAGEGAWEKGGAVRVTYDNGNSWFCLHSKGEII